MGRGSTEREGVKERVVGWKKREADGLVGWVNRGGVEKTGKERLSDRHDPGTAQAIFVAPLHSLIDPDRKDAKYGGLIFPRYNFRCHHWSRQSLVDRMGAGLAGVRLFLDAYNAPPAAGTFATAALACDFISNPPDTSNVQILCRVFTSIRLRRHTADAATPVSHVYSRRWSVRSQVARSRCCRCNVIRL